MGKNRNYDPNIFTVTKEQKDIALLPGVGLFCKCGCGKRIEGKLVTKELPNKTIKFFRKPQKGKVFFSQNCKSKFYQRTLPKKLRPSLKCLISLIVNNDKIPYRELTLYLATKHKLTFRITPDQKELWNTLEKVCRYRKLPSLDTHQVQVSAI